MKHLLLILLFVPFISFGQEDIERFKLYPTENMWTFLELGLNESQFFQNYQVRHLLDIFCKNDSVFVFYIFDC